MDEPAYSVEHTDQMDGWQFLRLHAGELDRYLDAYTHSDSRKWGIQIAAHRGFKGTDLRFLRDVPQLKALYIQDATPDLSAIFELQHLEWLLLPSTRQEIDFTFWPRLNVLRCHWGPQLKGIDSCANLRKLYVRNFNPRSKSLKSLGLPSRLVELELAFSNIASLDGISFSSSLVRLELHYLRDLSDIEDLRNLHESMEALEMTHCKKLGSYKAIADLRNLKRLIIGHCSDMPSLGFLASLHKLELLTFLGTNVKNGDLSPCLGLPNLNHIAYTDKRHFSHKAKDLRALLRGE